MERQGWLQRSACAEFRTIGWSFIWEVKGEEFLRKLVQQDLFLTRDLRQLTDALAKGKVALAFGIGRSQAEPFVKAGLPIKPAPAPREGLPAPA